MKAGDNASSGKRTDATRERIRSKALLQGQQRSAETRERVLAAMATIEQEMAANGGIYPQNKGAVSAAEVARRADVHTTTFFSPKQRDLGNEVRAWLDSLKKREAVSVRAIKRSLAERISDWRELYDGLAQSHRDTELQLQQVESELAKVRELLAATSHERDALREQLTLVRGASVVPLHPKRK